MQPKPSGVSWRLFATVLLLHVAINSANSQESDTSCPTQPTCDSTITGCFGYGEMSITCPNGTKLSSGPCYVAELCASVAANQGNDWIRIAASNINPQQCHAYSGQIKENLLGAYNSWCCQGDNYLQCCPGSTAWPTGVEKTAANCAAMQNASTEILYAGATGSATRTEFMLQLRPPRDSPLCQLLVYSTSTSAVPSGATTTGASTTGANSGANSTTSTSTTAATSTTSTGVSPTSGTNESTSTTSAVGRRRRDVASGNDQTYVYSQQLRQRRSVSVSVVITLDSQTIGQLISNVSISNLVISAIATASNGSVTVTVTVQQNVAPASSLSPDRRSDSWKIATGTICGFVGAVIVAYLIACVVHRSKASQGDRLPL